MERISVKDRVYEEVLAHILNGDYPANTILNEKDLIEKYSASKTTVREVLVQNIFQSKYSPVWLSTGNDSSDTDS